MSRIKAKYIVFGNSTDQVNSRLLPANFTPTNYTPDEVATEGNDKVSAHLKGIDTYLGLVPSSSAGDISETSFTFADNQSSPANVTGFVFDNAKVRGFDALVTIVRSTSYESVKLTGIQRGSDWQVIAQSVGDVTGLEFDVSSLGQVTYTSTNTGSGGTIKFRAITTTV